ncbi:biotin--[acetyl-CoA-carboxylase] ligase [Spongiimicrobium sp. 3-5]|uniref:biotin--[acetyl-CoA-carboxylase] ligase n=1 Tax=Spongiimicrobium sp. 3-5 TaxID=3332596 RepID=UPI00397F7CE7
MKLVKLDATDSTNLYLKNSMLSNTLDDYTVVMTKKQLKGRGQMGTTWLSEAGKNLTFSVLKNNLAMPASKQFLLNKCVSLAVSDALKEFGIPNITIKWPNDILSGHYKICGILIENVLSGNKIQASIIGVGLNVNQTKFNDLPHVSSLKLILGRKLELEELLMGIVKALKKYLNLLPDTFDDNLHMLYEDRLFRKDKPSTFKNVDGDLFMGFIRGVSDQGKLIVGLEDDVLKEYDLKEIKLLY